MLGKLPLGAAQLLAVGEALQIAAQRRPPLQTAQLARFGIIVAAVARLRFLPLGIFGDDGGAELRLDGAVLRRERVRFGADLVGNAIVRQSGDLRQARSDLRRADLVNFWLSCMRRA